MLDTNKKIISLNELEINNEEIKKYIGDKVGVTVEPSETNGNLKINGVETVIYTPDDIQEQLDTKAPLESPTLTGTPKAPTATVGTNTTQVATTAFVQTAVSNLVNGAPETMNTLKELSDAIEEHQDVTDALNSAITNKVDKVDGKGLSTNDYTTTEKTKLSGIATGAEVNQNSFSNVKVGTTTIAADAKTDTLELVAGTNVTLTPDATNDKITISSKDTTYNVATSSANGLMSSTDKAKLDATNVAYGTCSTAADVSEKVITISGNTNWKLVAGSIIIVKFTNTNTASNPTFNVNNTGAKSIWYNTSVITTASLAYAGTANRPMIFSYDGTQFMFISWSVDNNTTYTNAALGQGYGTCATAEATTAKVVTLSSYTLSTGGIVAIKFTYAVPASATMNINSKGAKNIFYRGSAITASVIKAGDIATFIYDGTQYHLLTVDRDVDTKNTAGSTNSSSKLFLVGATSQAANPQTYSHDTAYVGTDGCLYSGGKRCDTEVISSTEPTGQITGDFWLQSY